MKNKLFLLFIVILTTLITCSRILEPEDKDFTISGTVQNKYTKAAVDSAKVVVVSGSFENIQYSDESGVSANADIEQVSTFTNSEGFFEIETELEDTRDIAVLISKPAYFDTTLSIEGAEPGEKSELGKIDLLPDYQPLEIRGQLLNSFNNEPIEGGLVLADFLDAPLTTDEQGKFNFSLEINQSRTFQLYFEKEYFVTDTVTVSVNPEENKNLDKIYLDYVYKQAEISGKVVDEKTGKALNNAKIIDQESKQYTSTDKEGNFNLALQINTPQSISLMISKDPYNTLNKTLDLVTPEEEINLGNLSLTPPEMSPITINGWILDSLSNNPISNAKITIEQYPILSAQSDAEGKFSLTIEEPKTSPDTLDIKITPQSNVYNEVTLNNIIVASGDSRTLETIRLTKNVEYQDLIGIKGSVQDQFGYSINNAQVSIEEYPDFNAITDENGDFVFADSLSITETKLLHFSVNKSTYFAAEVTKKVTPSDVEVNLGNIVIDKRLPAGIEFEGYTPKTIRVADAGGEESTNLTFQVEDKLGNPFDIAGEAKVYFAFDGNTGMGENGATLSSDSTETDDEGKAFVELRSGKRAGLVKIRAYIDYKYKGENIYEQTRPVVLTIHGGFPVPERFNVYPAQRNIHGFVEAGLEDLITAYAGDLWGNAVKEETAIWFTTDWSKKPDYETAGVEPELGYIMTTEETGLTDNSGRATATLISAPPNPSEYDAINPPVEGLYTIYAHTKDSLGNEIIDSTTVLFSSDSKIEFVNEDWPVEISYEGYQYTDTMHVSLSDSTYQVVPVEAEVPTTADLTFFVTDINNNPLVAGTQLTTKLGDNGALSVATNFPEDGLADTKLTGELPLTPAREHAVDKYTNFNISIGTPHIDEVNEQPFYGGTSVEINITSPNGNLSAVIPVRVVHIYKYSWIPQVLGTYSK